MRARSERVKVDRTEGAGRARSLLHSFTLTIRQLAGMPDYISYAEHLRRCHPEAPLPTEREFYEAFIRARYEDGPTRCC
jgi:uncharacterized short protein YbdD (DUF466 family)